MALIPTSLTQAQPAQAGGAEEGNPIPISGWNGARQSHRSCHSRAGNCQHGEGLQCLMGIGTFAPSPGLEENNSARQASILMPLTINPPTQGPCLQTEAAAPSPSSCPPTFRWRVALPGTAEPWPSGRR